MGGINKLKERAAERERAQLEKQQAVQQRRVSKKPTKEERLAQEVLRMYKHWDSMRGVEMKHEGFFPPELEYFKRKQRRPAAESRIRDKCTWLNTCMDRSLARLAYSW